MTTTYPSQCVFCDIVAGRAPAAIVRRWPHAIAIRPRRPVAAGHLLVLPRQHVRDVGTNPTLSAHVMAAVAELAAEVPDVNVITSRGDAATQTVFHLHVHVVPRHHDDGLPLPWTPQQREVPPPTSLLNLVCAREPIPSLTPSVFLAGPTPLPGSATPSWRPAAVGELEAQWSGPARLTVLTPESRNGRRASRYTDQVAWETAARAAATAILFWIPRDLSTLPGFTTNVEFGLDAGSGRAVLGCPPSCPNPERNRYLVFVAGRHAVPVRDTLASTVSAALAIVRRP